jgi:abortive infection protein
MMAKQSQEPWFLIQQRILVGDVPQKSPGVTFGLMGLASIALGFIGCPPIPWGATAISITLSAILTIRKRLTWSKALLASVPAGAVLNTAGLAWHIAPITILLLQLALSFRKKVPKEVKIASLHKIDTSLTLLTTAGITCLASAFMIWYTRSRILLISYSPWLPIPFQIFTASIVNALIEEIIFRKTLFRTLENFGSPTIVAASGITFGLAHWSSGIPFGLIGVTSTTIYGLALSLLYNKTGSLTLPVLSHIIVNAITLGSLTC